MKHQEKQVTADVVRENPIWIKVGKLKFRVKPPTLGQIYEMGAIAIEIDEKDLKTKIEQKRHVRVMAEAISHYNDARLMQEIFLVLVFRKKFWRWLWRKYIFARLTVNIFNQLIQFVGQSLNINFFLTSIIFLKQTTAITEPMQTTARGQSSEE